VTVSIPVDEDSAAPSQLSDGFNQAPAALKTISDHNCGSAYIQNSIDVNSPRSDDPSPVADALTAPRSTWQRIDPADPETASATRRLADGICARDERASLEHDMTWLLGGGAGAQSKLIVLLCSAGRDVIGYVPVRIARARLMLYLGHVRLLSVAAERYSIIGSPLFCDDARKFEAQLTSDLLREITRQLPPRTVVLAYGARSDSALFEGLHQETIKTPGFRIVRQGAIYQRRLIRRNGGYEDYLAGLGRKTRETLRRQQRRLMTQSDGKTILKRYMSVDDVKPFLDAAIAISRLTYQWQLYGSGLSDRESLEPRLEMAARNGWLCSYVLFQRDQPIAFMMGVRYRATYLSQEIGYDPEWRQYSVGNVLHCLAVKDLLDNFPEIREFDFLFGDAPHKRQLSNASRNEGNFYLIPNTPWGLLASAVLRLDNLALSVNASLEGSKFKRIFKQLLRGWSSRQARAGPE
jgi:CelD/BcsL family acetyltransferase involved in cellulose biosynthesis